MQPPKVNSRVDPAELARDAEKAGATADRQTATDRDTAQPASDEDADTDSAGEIADGQEQVIDRSLTRLPPG